MQLIEKADFNDKSEYLSDSESITKVEISKIKAEEEIFKSRLLDKIPPPLPLSNGFLSYNEPKNLLRVRYV